MKLMCCAAFAIGIFVLSLFASCFNGGPHDPVSAENSGGNNVDGEELGGGERGAENAELARNVSAMDTALLSAGRRRACGR